MTLATFPDILNPKKARERQKWRMKKNQRKGPMVARIEMTMDELMSVLSECAFSFFFSQSILSIYFTRGQRHWLGGSPLGAQRAFSFLLIFLFMCLSLTIVLFRWERGRDGWGGGKISAPTMASRLLQHRRFAAVHRHDFPFPGLGCGGC